MKKKLKKHLTDIKAQKGFAWAGFISYYIVIHIFEKNC